MLTKNKLFVLYSVGGYLSEYLVGIFDSKIRADNAWIKHKKEMRRRDYCGDGARKLIEEVKLNFIIVDE